MVKFKKVKVIGNVIGYNRYAFSKKETYNVQFPDMTIAELKSYQFEDADAYHTDGKTLCLRNVLARLHELPEHDREVWLKGIMDEFELDFSHAKWREGYEQGKFEGMIEPQKVVVPQFVAEWYEEHKNKFYLNLHKLAWELIENLDEDCFVPEKALDSDFKRWYHKNETAIQTLINMHQFGYTTEKEKRYSVKIKGVAMAYFYLKKDIRGNWWLGGDSTVFGKYHTRKELEDAGFGWVFDCEGVEVQEVE